MKHTLGGYDIVAELGRGGMGVVYKAYEPALNRFVAIKMLGEALAHDAGLVERFMREARSMAALNDPHIIQIYSVGQDQGQPYFVMEFVDGESLGAKLKREGRLAPGEALQVLLQTARGLATAHDRGVVHRDIKPGNLMINQRGMVKIADFGIALATQDFAKKLTSTGEFVGTPGYLSPEVCLGQPVDQRSDIFSLGIVLFEMLTGRIPFSDQSPLGMMLEVVKAEIPDLRELNAEVDGQLESILRRMIAKAPADRFQSCHLLVEAIEAHPLSRGTAARITPPPRSTAAETVFTPVPRPAAPATPASPVSAPATAAPTVTASPVAARPKTARAWGLAAALLVALGAAAGTGWLLIQRGAGDASAQLAAPAPQSATPPTKPVAQPAASKPGRAATAPAAAPAGPTDAAALATVPEDAQTLRAEALAAIEPVQPETTLGSSTVTAPPAQDPVGAAVAVETAAPVELQATVPVAAVQRASAAPDARPPSAGGALEPAALNAPAPAAAAAVGSEAAGTELASAPANSPRPQPVQVAQASPPRAAAPERPRERAVPSLPQVVVLAIGDPVLTGPAERRIEDALLQAGFRLVEKTLIPGLARRLNQADADVAELLDFIGQSARIDAVVLVRTRYLGEQQLTYYGQSSTLYSSTLQLRAFSVAERRPLGAAFEQRVDFTSLNADYMAGEAVDAHLQRLLAQLEPYRPRVQG